MLTKAEHYQTQEKSKHERIISFWVGEQIYGMPLLLAGEFCPEMLVTPVDAVDQRIAGIAHLRETTAVVLDMRRILRASSTTCALKESIYVLPHSNLCDEALERGLQSFDEPVVLEVDRLGQIVDIDLQDVHPTPAQLAGSFYDGVYDSQSGDIILLNYSKLIDSLMSELSERLP